MSYADFDDDFQAAPIPDSYDEAPCGTYQCEIVKFFDNTTKDETGRLNCVLQVVSGEHDGKVLFKSWLLTPSAMSYIKADFKRFGLPVDTVRFSELRKMLDTDVIGQWCEAVKKVNEKDERYTNVYINAMIDPLARPAHKTPPQATPGVDLYADAKAVAAEKSDDVPDW